MLTVIRKFVKGVRDDDGDMACCVTTNEKPIVPGAFTCIYACYTCIITIRVGIIKRKTTENKKEYF